ncbi:hypothetical protein H257_17558 [Aphanomyces astaci]|uniref:Uncharacterized protein n=1 Tax=Aphanomyces astaci TaxID=112090 RepID=W4FG35_APHAT|nr:hypothetical protein H257_17558 [Aphanomyces astaci]ETV65829.1 hypothetical protein H257_17558 [Aphanomyces astaci]|eukprot:XP_009844692.1 hypothetical protein H257_17558 [Aphanomyces astaci]
MDMEKWRGQVDYFLIHESSCASFLYVCAIRSNMSLWSLSRVSLPLSRCCDFSRRASEMLDAICIAFFSHTSSHSWTFRSSSGTCAPICCSSSINLRPSATFVLAPPVLELMVGRAS